MLDRRQPRPHCEPLMTSQPRPLPSTSHPMPLGPSEEAAGLAGEVCQQVQGLRGHHGSAHHLTHPSPPWEPAMMTLSLRKEKQRLSREQKRVPVTSHLSQTTKRASPPNNELSLSWWVMGALASREGSAWEALLFQECSLLPDTGQEQGARSAGHSPDGDAHYRQHP